MSDNLRRQIGYPGPPTHGNFNLYDIATDINGVDWVCLKPGAGSGATFVSADKLVPVLAGL